MSQQFRTLTETITLRFGQEVQLSGEIVYDESNSMLYLVTLEDSEVLSINLDTYGLPTPHGHVWIKNWSEHTGVAAQLSGLSVVDIKDTAHVGPFDSEAHLVKIVAQ